MNKHESAWAGSGKWRWCVIECRNAGRYANVAEMGCKWGVFLPSDAQPDTLSTGIKQPGLCFFCKRCAQFSSFTGRSCVSGADLWFTSGEKQREDVMIIRGVIDKASWVHISSLAQTLSSMTCLLEVQQQAVGNIYNVIDNKPKKDHSSV